jgi:hypothetical protein
VISQQLWDTMPILSLGLDTIIVSHSRIERGYINVGDSAAHLEFFPAECGPSCKVTSEWPGNGRKNE